MFYAIVMNFQHIVRTAEEGVCVTVFFNEDASDARIAEIGDLIRLRPEVSKVDFVSGVGDLQRKIPESGKLCGGLSYKPACQL